MIDVDHDRFFLPPATDEPRNQSHNAKSERAIWQRRIWEHVIWDDGDYAAHVDYCHINPLEHGYVK